METISTTPNPKKIVPLSIKLETEQKDLLAQIAKKEDRSVHFLLCQAVKEFLDREQAKADFYETAKNAGEHYRKTGLHTTHEELKAWANSLGSNHELAPPTCHK
jgi:predicted transcriptional regulator